MQRYRFHVLNDTSYQMDEEGIVLPDPGAAERHAREVIAASLPTNSSREGTG